MRAHAFPDWAVRPLRYFTRGRTMIATVVVLSALALWVALGVGNAATSSDAVQVEPSTVSSFVRAAKSCPTLTPARLAAQVMAKTGFKPTSDGGVAGLSKQQWKTWAPSTGDSPENREASLLALAHLTCDLVGQIRVSGVVGDRWRLAVAASESSVQAVKDAAGVPPSVAAFVDRVVGYADFYASGPLFGGGAATATPSTVATAEVAAPATPTASPTAKPSQAGSVSAQAKATGTAGPAKPAVQIQRDSFADASGLQLNGSAHVTNGRLFLASDSAQAASAWATTRIDPSRSFQTSFVAQISKITDGVAFLVQSQGPNALGNDGSRLGYGQNSTDSAPAVKPSLAVELDTWGNNSEGLDPTGQGHIAVTLNGEYSNHRTWRDPGFTMWGDQPVRVTISYNASTHTLSVWAASTAQNAPAGAMMMTTQPPLLTYGVDLPTVVGTGPAYVGFTGGTGMTTVTDAQESIIQWSLVSG